VTSRRSDAERLGDILRSMERMSDLLDAGFEAFASSWLHQSAALYELETIGEACAELPPTVRRLHPEIRWDEMRGFATIAHRGRWEVRPEILWNAVEEMPGLRRKFGRVESIP
jgi:uncharacterized protein with HEPN domain